MFGPSVAGIAVWYLVFGCLTLLTGGLYVYGRTQAHPDHSLARYQRAIGGLVVLSGLLLAIEVVFAILARVLWVLVTTSVVGLDLIYFVLGALLVASGSVLAHARWGTPDDETPLVRHTRLLGSVFVVSLVFLVAYAVLASAGWVTLVTVMFGDRAETFGSLDSFYPHATVEASDQVWELSADEREIPETFTHEGTTIETTSHLEATGTTGLIVAHNETIVHESYYQGYDESSRATSWSASKSITSALAGIAIEEGHIDSVDDPVSKYVTELEGSTYGDVTVRQLLTMSSGIEWEESGSPTSELTQLFPDAYGSGQSWRDQMGQYDRAFTPGQYHRYASADTIVLSLVIQDATGQSLSEYLETRIWQPAGMEGDATWMIDSEGAEVGMCCFNAQLRDYTRFGLLFLNNGAHDGEQIVPAEWVNTSTTPQPPNVWRDDSRTQDYGYKWWIPADSDHEYMAEGLYGQYVYVNTEADVVITKTSTSGGVEETLSLFRAITDDVTE
jgi:CubicO group peptidase (beta-lactamase class C family)